MEPVRDVDRIIDTLIISKLINFSRPDGHSIESYGLEFNLPKLEWNDWSKYDERMVEYCKRDCDISHEIYTKFHREITSRSWRESIRCEHEFQRVVNDLHHNGFAFDSDKAATLLDGVVKDLEKIDADLSAFPSREIFIKDFVPKSTKFGTINKTSVPRSLWPNIHEYEIGKTYRHTKTERFNPDSPKQIIDVLTEAGWRPVDKTKGHIEAIRSKKPLDKFIKYGYKINEDNLSTLPKTAPAAAKTIAKRILIEARRRTLTEWLSLVATDGRIHGSFQGIGAWTHRMSHQKPNMANIPNSHDNNGQVKLLGGEMRSLFIAPPGRLLVGVDAEGIQLRIFAHYVDNEELTNAIVAGRKEDKTDPHSYNQRILGRVCKSRAASKRFLYALFLGAGLGKLADILGASREETESALGRLLREYPGFAKLKETIIPKDAKRGVFTGLDGRLVPIPGETQRDREHLAMSGYLQNGEAVAMKHATLMVYDELPKYDALLVDLVHDEWQTECPNNIHICGEIAELYCDALRKVGEKFKLKCPLAGSYIGDNGITIGQNWKVTH
jgi:DNA polymerase-1